MAADGRVEVWGRGPWKLFVGTEAGEDMRVVRGPPLSHPPPPNRLDHSTQGTRLSSSVLSLAAIQSLAALGSFFTPIRHARMLGMGVV